MAKHREVLLQAIEKGVHDERGIEAFTSSIDISILELGIEGLIDRATLLRIYPKRLALLTAMFERQADLRGGGRKDEAERINDFYVFTMH